MEVKFLYGPSEIDVNKETIGRKEETMLIAVKGEIWEEVGNMPELAKKLANPQ